MLLQLFADVPPLTPSTQPRPTCLELQLAATDQQVCSSHNAGSLQLTAVQGIQVGIRVWQYKQHPQVVQAAKPLFIFMCMISRLFAREVLAVSKHTGWTGLPTIACMNLPAKRPILHFFYEYDGASPKPWGTHPLSLNTHTPPTLSSPCQQWPCVQSGPPPCSCSPTAGQERKNQEQQLIIGQPTLHSGS